MYEWAYTVGVLFLVFCGVLTVCIEPYERWQERRDARKGED